MKWDGPANLSRTGCGRRPNRLAADAFKGLANRERPGIKVNISPA